jgi:hypothetical protein
VSDAEGGAEGEEGEEHKDERWWMDQDQGVETFESAAAREQKRELTWGQNTVGRT